MPHRFRRAVATAAILCGLVVAAFEGTVVTSAMPTIARDLGGMAEYPWVFSAFLLASSVSVVACGRMADALGRRPVFLAGIGLFVVGSIACGAAGSIEQLVAFRVVQGLGAGAIQPIAMTIGADLYPFDERPKMQAMVSTVWGTSTGIGPVLGGIIVTHLSWRWVFLVNVPVAAIAVALLVASYRDPPRAAVERPRIAWRVLTGPVVRAGLVSGMFTGGLLHLCAAYVPLWMETRAHAGAIGAGLALVPLLVGWSIGSGFGVRVLVRRGMRTSVGGGFAIALAGAVALACVAGLPMEPHAAFGALAVLGLGLGAASATSLVAAQSNVGWGERGMVTSAVYAARVLGGAVAVAALGHAGDGATRFDGIALLALAAVVTLASLAPRGRAAIAMA